MKIARIVLFVMLAVAVNALAAWLNNLPQDVGADVPGGKISSFSFAPFREGQSPLTAVFPTTEQIDADMRLLADKTHAIRTYASLGGLKEVPALARKYGLKVIQGAWLGYSTMQKENDAEVQALIQAANDYPDVIDRVIVGNEVLLRGEMKPEQLIAYIRAVKQAVKQPVSYADVWSFYIQHPEIAREVDFITVHILPYWEDDPLSIEKSAAHIEAQVRKIHTAFPGKPILIGESGWPSAGRQRGWAVPSVVNEARFIRSLLQVANKNGFDYNIVEAFNQPWKSKLEGVVGANWGLYSAAREEVFPLTGKVTENPRWPQRVLCAGFLTLLAVALHFRRCLQLSTLRLAAFAGFAQLLAALLVNQSGDLWYTSYSGLQRGQAAFVVLSSAVMGGMLARRALDLLSAQQSGAALSIALRYVLTIFIALAVYKSLGLALNGRYQSIPYPLTGIAVAGIMGLGLIRRFAAGVRAAEAFCLDGLFGDAPPSLNRDRAVGYALLFIGVVLIAVETLEVMSGAEFLAAYPLSEDRAWAAFMATRTQSQLPGWTLLIAAALIAAPRNTAGYLLPLLCFIVIAGETRAFTFGHDFIDAHPQLDDRLWTAFVYTAVNCQMLLWLASLLALALPLWPGAGKKAQAEASQVRSPSRPIHG